MSIYFNPKFIKQYEVLYTSGGTKCYGQHFELPLHCDIDNGDILEWQSALWRSEYVRDWVEIQHIYSTGTLPYMLSYRVHTLELNNNQGYKAVENKKFYTNRITSTDATLYVHNFNENYQGIITGFSSLYGAGSEEERNISTAYKYIRVINGEVIKENWIPAIVNSKIGMYDTISNRFIEVQNNRSTQGYSTVENEIIDNSKGKIISIAFFDGISIKYPNQVWFANSQNSVKLVYETDIHIVNLSLNTKFNSISDKISAVEFSNDLTLKSIAYGDIFDISYHGTTTVEFAALNSDNETYTIYVVNPYYNNNISTIYCYGSFSMCFNNLKNLRNLNLKKINTKNVTNMIGMFQNCNSIEELDLSSFDTENVTDMRYMFNGCTNLRNLNLKKINTKNVTNMGGMFQNCNSIEELNLRSFDTENVTDMSYMFNSCQELNILKLGNFDTSNILRIDNMFWKCAKLKTIFAQSFNLSQHTTIFDGCTSLVGENGTTYNSQKVSSVYARIDGRNGLEGYFTTPEFIGSITEEFGDGGELEGDDDYYDDDPFSYN